MNCHPFVGRDNRGRVWTLAHNGTVFRGDALGPYFAAQEGRTDSERLLLLLLDRVGARQDALGRALGPEERFAEFAVLARELSPGNKLNLLVYDGEALYAHANAAGSLHLREDPSGAAVLSTRPLGSGDGWAPLPLCAPSTTAWRTSANHPSWSTTSTTSRSRSWRGGICPSVEELAVDGGEIGRMRQARKGE